MAEKTKLVFGGVDGAKVRNKIFKVIFVRYKDKETGNQKVLALSAKTGNILFTFRAVENDVKFSTSIPEFQVESKETKATEVVA